MNTNLPPVTVINGVEIDLRSEAMHDTECADCNRPIQVDPSLDAIPEEHRHLERVAVCDDCARLRMRAAITDQRNIEIVRHNTQEKRMQIDLNTLSDAELGAMVRERMMAKVAEALPAKREAAVVAEQVAVQADAVERKVEQERRHNAHPLVGFTVGTLDVPTLDLSEVTNLDECVSAALRAPYNKARFRLEASAPLPSPKACEEDASLVPTTYAVLAAEHVRLSALAAIKAAAVRATWVEPQVQVIAAVQDETAAKVAALMQTIPTLDEAGARALLATL